MSGANVPGGQLVEHWLLGQLAGKGQLVRLLGDGKLLAVAVWSSTLLGPEEAAASLRATDPR